MANHSVRSAIVLVLLFGTFALAVPAVSRQVDEWLFSDDGEGSKWLERDGVDPLDPADVKRPTAPKISQEPRLLPANDNVRRLASTDSDDFETTLRDIAHTPQTPQTNGNSPYGAMQATYLHEEASGEPDVASLEGEFRGLGVSYVVVEPLEHQGAFECRCLVPLSPESSYQKAFSAVGSTEVAAAEQVLAEVRAWRRAAATNR